MTQDTIEYGNWKRIDPVWPDFQLVVVRNDATGKVLAIEKDPGYVPWDHNNPFQVVLLPEDYYDTDEPPNVEYVARHVTEEEARRLAALYVEEHSDG